MKIVVLIVVCVMWSTTDSQLIHEILRRSAGLGNLQMAMTELGDTDKDGTLSGEEIQDFFRYFVNLSPANSLLTARQFIKDGDFNGDGKLNETELQTALRIYRGSA
ncbi:uncharacterized protein LOC133201312 [Saccostrea echinata]|uniref:uncharacterized protein LOC133201312 n=1 Tax=Saccostrea echinata TaxID=191078 RepID=UPI002A7EA905|nr:uncharacterized protein LOC133201312 [Saccostrea echinata]